MMARLLSALAVLALWCWFVPTVLCQTPTAIFHDANTILTYRAIPSCALNVHGLSNPATWSSVGMWQLGGESCLSSIDYSPSGSFDQQNQFATIVPTFNFSSGNLYQGDNPSNRLAGAAALLGNGVLIYGGGKAGTCPNPTYSTRTNDVMYSTNQGYLWNRATAAAAWCARSDFMMAPAPNTNIVVLVGGTCNGAVALNDVWISSDGIGAMWTLQTAAGNFQPWTQGSITFMFDSPTTPTLAMYSPYDDAIITSPDLGVTWIKGAMSLSALGSAPSIDARLISDVQNNLYLVGGLSGNPQIIYSTNKGQTVSFINQLNWSPNISNVVMIDTFTYGCVGFRYLPANTATGYHKQMILYGGTIVVGNLVDSNYRCFFDTGSVTFPQTTSVQVEIILPGDVYTLPQQSNPPASLQPRLVSHDAAQLLTPRAYADCAYDVHQAVRRGANLSMWSLGGYDLNGNFLNSIDYTATGNWNNIRVVNNPTYNGAPNGVSPSGRVAAGVALLANGNLLYFAGKDYNSSAPNAMLYANDVYYSTNQGQSFTFSALAPFIPRSDFATAVLPMTNIVVIAGGMYSATSNPNGSPMNDVWYSSDGAGATWVQASAAGPFPQFTDAAFVSLYDGQASGGSQQYSTLLLYVAAYEANQTLYASTNLGASWTAQAAAPWSYRQKAMLVADAEGYVYLTGGTDTGDVWFSWDKGVSWININTPGTGLGNGFGNNNNLFNPSSLYVNLFQYIAISGTSGNCMALRYVADSLSPNNYHKQLILYGGAYTIEVANRPSASCVQQSYVNVVYTEVMFPMEYQNPSWTNSLVVSVPGTVPQVAFNTPSSLFTYRQYPTCAYDVHSLVQHSSAPAQFSLGGWDANGNVLSTYDRINGSNFGSYAYVFAYNPGAVAANMVPGRAASGAGYLSNGNLVWFGGKTNTQISVTAVLANDVWYTTNPTWTTGTWPPPAWQQATAAASWSPRSDMTIAVFPGTQCVLLVGGAGTTANLNDVWQSCDGIGAVWTVQTTNPGFLPFTDGAMTALYDGTATGGSQSSATVLLYPSSYPSYGQSIYGSTNAGQSWSFITDAPWSSRFTARFIADAESNVYMVGGQLGDTWYSNNKGQIWYQMQPVTNLGYSQPFQLASATYACGFINYQSGSGPQGYHRQLTVYSGFVAVYPSTLQVGGPSTFGNFSVPQCVCDTVTGARAALGDLVFPGETVSPNTNSGSSSSSGNTFSSGQTAGIAVGVGVGCLLLCLVGILAVNSCSLSRKSSAESDTIKPTKFENEPSGVATTSQLEMAETNAQGEEA